MKISEYKIRDVLEYLEHIDMDEDELTIYLSIKNGKYKNKEVLYIYKKISSDNF